jgi:L-rhamnose mutarotase
VAAGATSKARDVVRKAYLQTLRRGCERAYRAHHRRVWPEVEALYREAGYTDLSCFLSGRTLVVWVEYDPKKMRRKRAWLARHPVERRWQAVMNELKEAPCGGQDLAEIYRLPS